jgi:hypothetical protein
MVTRRRCSSAVSFHAECLLLQKTVIWVEGRGFLRADDELARRAEARKTAILVAFGSRYGLFLAEGRGARSAGTGSELRNDVAITSFPSAGQRRKILKPTWIDPI